MINRIKKARCIFCVDVWICKELGSSMAIFVICMPWYHIYSSVCILHVIFQPNFSSSALSTTFSFSLLEQSLCVDQADLKLVAFSFLFLPGAGIVSMSWYVQL